MPDPQDGNQAIMQYGNSRSRLSLEEGGPLADDRAGRDRRGFTFDNPHCQNASASSIERDRQVPQTTGSSSRRIPVRQDEPAKASPSTTDVPNRNHACRKVGRVPATSFPRFRGCAGRATRFVEPRCDAWPQGAGWCRRTPPPRSCGGRCGPAPWRACRPGRALR